ncbi:hypothetical protein [Streptomyces sp. NPDC058614]|uniref:hypothetical protein n=1 Tax=Streptomyces sp. NPDC058614 TaxID=3346557 RepID=UPI00364DB46E
MGKKPRPRRSFTPEFMAEIVELCRRGDRSVGQIANQAVRVHQLIQRATRTRGQHDPLARTAADALLAA